MAKKIQKLQTKVDKENASIKKYTEQIKELEAKRKKSIEERDAARLKIYDILAGGRSLEELEAALSEDDEEENAEEENEVENTEAVEDEDIDNANDDPAPENVESANTYNRSW